MRNVLLILVMLFSLSTYAQDDVDLFTTSDGKFAFEIPYNWELMKEEDGRITIIYVGDEDITQYTVISLGFIDGAPTFEDNDDAVQFMLGRNTTADDFETEQIGDYTVLLREQDKNEADTLFAIVLLDDGVIGAVQANEMDFLAELDELRPVVDAIITSVIYIEPQSDPLDSLELITVDTSDLTLDYESEKDITFRYPEGWVIQSLGNEVILVATSEFTGVAAPDFGIQIFTSPNPPGATTSGEFLHELLPILMDSLEFSSNAEIVDINLDGRRAAYVEDSSKEIILLAVIIDAKGFAAFIGLPGEEPHPDAETITYAIASTLQRIPPDMESVEVDTSTLTKTHSAANGLYTFSYPEEWRVNDSDGMVQVFNSEDSLDDKIDENEINIIVTVFSKSKEEGIDRNATLVEVAEAIQSPTRLNDTPPTELLINGTPAVMMDMGIAGIGGKVVYVELNSDLVGQVMTIINEGDFNMYQETVLAIASSIELNK